MMVLPFKVVVLEEVHAGSIQSQEQSSLDEFSFNTQVMKVVKGLKDSKAEFRTFRRFHERSQAHHEDPASRLSQPNSLRSLKKAPHPRGGQCSKKNGLLALELAF